MQECEVILLKEPNAPDILAMLGEIEARLQASGHTLAASSASNGLTTLPNYGANGAGKGNNSLVEVAGRNSTLKGKRAAAPQLGERGDDHLGKFLIVQQLFPVDEVNEALASVNRSNKELAGQELGFSLLDYLCKNDELKMDQVLSQLLDRTKFAFIPLEYYDIDRHVVRMLRGQSHARPADGAIRFDQPHDHGGDVAIHSTPPAAKRCSNLSIIT